MKEIWVAIFLVFMISVMKAASYVLERLLDMQKNYTVFVGIMMLFVAVEASIRSIAHIALGSYGSFVSIIKVTWVGFCMTLWLVLIQLVVCFLDRAQQGALTFREKMHDLQCTLVARAYSLLLNNWKMILLMMTLRLTGLFDDEREGLDDIFWCIYTLAVEKTDVDQ